MIGSLDSRSIFASVGGLKKECSYENLENCTWKARFSDKKIQFDIQPGKLGTNIPEGMNNLDKGYYYKAEYNSYMYTTEGLLRVLYKYENVKDKEIQYI